MVQRHPDLAALGLVRLPRSSADRNDRRPRLLTERCPLDVGANEDECARGCVHALAVELERRAPALDEIQLFLQVMLLRLVVLVDEPIADLMSCECVDAERRDAEVEPDGSRKDAAVIDLVDLVDPRQRVTAHSAVLLEVVGTPLSASLMSAPRASRKGACQPSPGTAWLNSLSGGSSTRATAHVGGSVCRRSHSVSNSRQSPISWSVTGPSAVNAICGWPTSSTSASPSITTSAAQSC